MSSQPTTTEQASGEEPSSASAPPSSIMSRRRKLFGDCALVEIIHLHDCLRGAIKALEHDVTCLHKSVLSNSNNKGGGQSRSEMSDLERRVAGRFKVIWSVFRAHSSAEDEFIWPALQLKTQGKIQGSPPSSPQHHSVQEEEEENAPNPVAASSSSATSSSTTPTKVDTPSKSSRNETASALRGIEEEGIEQEEYEEDHADEERMFSSMDDLLTKLRSSLVSQGQQADKSLDDTMKEIYDLSKKLSSHLMVHLEKEENQCLPLVAKHLSKSEIHDLVGQIMGKRSSDMIAQIMTMAVQNLNETDREEMVKYMKQAMAGTFFDRWLSMSGWMTHIDTTTDSSKKRESSSSATNSTNQLLTEASAAGSSSKKVKVEDTTISELQHQVLHSHASNPAGDVTSQAELEKLIRAIASNPNLSAKQKNTTIQGLRDSVWKSNQLMRRQSLDNGSTATTTTSAQTMGVPHGGAAAASPSTSATASAASAMCKPSRRVTPPSMYFKKNSNGKTELIWTCDGPISNIPSDIPLFSATELAPTYHDGATGAVLGCPHYARACKLRHPQSGRLYTCRLCCEQDRDMPMKDQDEPLDRYEVAEVMCMKCNALQPAEDRCLNTQCESHGKAFAKYFCRICHLYDDRSRPIFHCPYCNTCRMGLGLGIDFRHCMRCNACVSLNDSDHRCIPQKLGSCPICYESLFQSTEPLKGLACGHVMHMKCFTEFRRGQNYTCPLCMRSMEDMSDYFALLDAAVRMQPMPTAYLSTKSNIYCQDCEQTGQCQYHFVGLKCTNCGSYNTREMGRVQSE